MAESKREQYKQRARLKKKPTKWYMLRIVFWALLLSFGFVMWFFGWFIGKYVS